MHPELRLFEDYLTDRGVLSLPALPRMLYLVRGAVTIGERRVAQGEAVFSESSVTAHSEKTGATIWRWELSDPRAAPVQPASSSIASHEKRSAPLVTLPAGELLWRGDSVAFPAGGCAYLHHHQGPGIRCLIEGELRIDMKGESHTHGIGDAWYESGFDPVFAQAANRPTRFIRVMILPRVLIGKSSVIYVNEEDKAKPKVQQYRVFVDTPLTRPA
jgi:hypothetical protein